MTTRCSGLDYPTDGRRLATIVTNDKEICEALARNLDSEVLITVKERVQKSRKNNMLDDTLKLSETAKPQLFDCNKCKQQFKCDEFTELECFHKQEKYWKEKCQEAEARWQKLCSVEFLEWMIGEVLNEYHPDFGFSDKGKIELKNNIKKKIQELGTAQADACLQPSCRTSEEATQK
jgi:hypothetical protein